MKKLNTGTTRACTNTPSNYKQSKNIGKLQVEYSKTGVPRIIIPSNAFDDFVDVGQKYAAQEKLLKEANEIICNAIWVISHKDKKRNPKFITAINKWLKAYNKL